MSAEKPILEGIVAKQGPPPWKTWKKRWLVLNTQGLTYYTAKKNKPTLKGTIPLSIITDVEPVQQSGKRKCFFKVSTPARAFVFAVDGEKKVEVWIDAIKKLRDTAKARRQSAASPKAADSKAPVTRTGSSPPPKVSQERSLSESGKSSPLAPATTTTKTPQATRPAANAKATKERKTTRGKETKKGEPRNKTKHGEVAIAPAASLEDKQAAAQFMHMLGVPPESELRKMSRSELLEINSRVDWIMQAELKRAEEDYLLKRNALVEELVKKETASIKQKYDEERNRILAEIEKKKKAKP